MSALQKAVSWLVRYILATIIILAVTYGGVWLYATLTRRSLSATLYWVLLGESILLIFIGIASGLSTSEYAYVRQGAINPLIMREGMKHYRRGPEKRGMGMLLGVVGLTIFLIWMMMYLR